MGETLLASSVGVDAAAVNCGVSVGAEVSAVSLSANARGDKDAGVRIGYTRYLVYTMGMGCVGGGGSSFPRFFDFVVRRAGANA